MTKTQVKVNWKQESKGIGELVLKYQRIISRLSTQQSKNCSASVL